MTTALTIAAWWLLLSLVAVLLYAIGRGPISRYLHDRNMRRLMEREWR